MNPDAYHLVVGLLALVALILVLVESQATPPGTRFLRGGVAGLLLWLLLHSLRVVP